MSVVRDGGISWSPDYKSQVDKIEAQLVDMRHTYEEFKAWCETVKRLIKEEGPEAALRFIEEEEIKRGRK